MRELDIDIPEGAEIARTYAGSNQRSCGAWSWFAWSRQQATWQCGSQWPIAELLKAPNIAVSVDDFGNIHLDPDPLPSPPLTDFQKWQLKQKELKEKNNVQPDDQKR